MKKKLISFDNEQADFINKQSKLLQKDKSAIVREALDYYVKNLYNIESSLNIYNEVNKKIGK